jgi:apolipoprotein N-acyltransferase
VRVRTGIVEIRNKEFLVPVGEYKPYFINLVSIFPRIDTWLTNTYKEHGYTKVPEREVVFKENEVGVLQCSEIISPVFYRSLAKDQKILANAASHGPLTSPFLIRHQTLKMARIHAVANDRFFIQAGNVAPSYVITNQGVIQSFLNSNNTDVLFDTVSQRNTITPYTRWGDWFVAFLVLVLSPLLFTVVARSQRNRL